MSKSEQDEKDAENKNPHAVALGRLGGLKGGKARFAALTAQEKSQLGRKAVLARWEKARQKERQTKGD